MQTAKFVSMALVAAAVSSVVQAGSLATTVGESYLSVDFNQQIAPAISITAGALSNFDDENTMASLGLGYSLPLGAANLTLGGRANWLAMDGHSNEMTLSLGGDLQIPIGQSLAFYSNAYWGPFATGDVDASFDGRLGVNWRVMQSVALDMGYRYATVEYDNGHQHELANGVYLGVNAIF